MQADQEEKTSQLNTDTAKNFTRIFEQIHRLIGQNQLQRAMTNWRILIYAVVRLRRADRSDALLDLLLQQSLQLLIKLEKRQDWWPWL